MLEARQIWVETEQHSLLGNVSLTVQQGRLLAVVGPNGAGKSTLLKVLSGETKPHAGHVSLNGRDLTRWSPLDRARRRAVLPQETALAFAFTALEVVLMGRDPHGPGRERDHLQIAQQAMTVAGVDHLAERLFPTLSGGERQRVQLARALAQVWEPLPGDEPRYLLLDEPTASLDIAHQHSILALARRFARQGLGVLAVLHDLNLAAQYADELAVLRDGRLQALGSPAEVLVPEVIDRAFDMPSMVIPHPTLERPLVIALPRE